MKTKRCMPLGQVIEDALDLAALVKRRMESGNVGSAGVTVWSTDGLVYATHVDGEASRSVQAFALIGVYNSRARQSDIAADIEEWRADA